MYGLSGLGHRLLEGVAQPHTLSTYHTTTVIATHHTHFKLLAALVITLKVQVSRVVNKTCMD